MRVLAFLGGAGALTSAIIGGPVGMVIGNLAVLAAVSALLMGTVSLERAPR